MDKGGRWEHSLKLGICLFGAAIVALGLVVLVGWYSHNEALIQIRPEFVPMQYNTALGFILSGAALLATVCHLPRVALACSAIVVALGIATLFEYIFGVDLGIDQLLMDHYITVLSSNPGRMAPNTALCFALAGAAMAVHDRWQPWVAQLRAIAGSLVLSLGLIAIIGYAMSLEPIYGWGQLTRMAVHTAVGFVLTGTALLLLSWRAKLVAAASTPGWLPVPVGVASLLFTLSLWQALHPDQGFETTDIAHRLLLIGGVSLSAALSGLVYLAQRAHRQQLLAETSLRELVQESNERIKTERQLQASEERLQFALKSNRDGVWDWDIENNEVYFSKRWKQMLGFEEDEIGNGLDEWKKRIHPDDKEQVFVDINRHFDKETSYYENEHRVLCKDGSYKWILDRGQVIAWTKDGKPQRMIGTHTDIGERKEIEESLRQAQNIVDYNTDMLALLDKNFHYRQVNAAYARAFGKMPTELIGRTPTDIFGKELFEAVIEPHARQCLNGKFVRYQSWMLFPSSGKRYMDISYAPYEDSAGKLKGFIVSAHDITKRKELEKNLQESESRWKTLTENSPNYIMLLDPDYMIQYINRTVPDLTIAQTTGKLVLDYVPPEDRATAIDCFQRVLQSGKSDSYETRYITDAGPVRHHVVRISPLFDKEGVVTNFISSSNDITEQKQTEESLQRANQIIESSPVVLFRWRATEGWPVEFVSNNVSQFGYAAAEFLSGDTPFNSIIHPDDLERVGKEVEHYTAAGKHEFQQEYRLVSPPGDIHWIDNRTTIERDEEGNATHYTGTIIDITARKQAEVEAKKRIAELDSVFNALPDLFFLMESDGTILEYRARKDADLYAPPETIVGNRMQDLLPEAVAQQFEVALGIANENDQLIAFEYTLQVSQELRHYEARISKLPDRPHLLALVRDITDAKHLQDQLQRIERALKTLVQVNQLIIKATSEPELLQNICQALVETGTYTLAWIGFAEHDKKKSVRPVANFGLDEGYIESLNISWADIPKGQGPTGTAIQNNEIVIAQNILNDPNFDPWRKMALQHGYKSSIAIPLTAKNKAMGAINIYSSEANAFNEDEVALLRQLAADLSFGIQSQRLEASEENYAQQLSASLGQTIEAIALTVETRDPYTAGHMNRVAELAVAIATEMGLSEDRIEGIQFGASIHDLGKIYVPGEILNRPGKLTAAEFDIIKSHSQVGYDIIKGIEFPWPVAEMVIQHHERLDGKGYPNGLQGDEIILESRILSVADVIEAVSSHRPYRPAKSIEVGLEIIEEGKGTMFDVEVVNACAKIIKEDGFKFSSLF